MRGNPVLGLIGVALVLYVLAAQTGPGGDAARTALDLTGDAWDHIDAFLRDIAPDLGDAIGRALDSLASGS